MKLSVEKLIAHAISVVETDDFLAYLFPPTAGDDKWLIGIIRAGRRREWRGWAAIPWKDYAEQRLADLETDNDVIDLLREWGIDEADQFTLSSFVVGEDR